MQQLKQYDDKKGKIPRHKQASSKDDNLETPDELYQYLCETNDIKCELDPFANSKNSKCYYYFTYEQNALNLEYLIPNGKPTDHKPKGVFINHPHTLHKEVLEHTKNQWSKHDLDILLIIPANTVRPPFWNEFIGKYLHQGIEVEPLINQNGNGYLNFKKEGKSTKFDSRNGYLLVRYFSQKKWTEHVIKLNKIMNCYG